MSTINVHREYDADPEELWELVATSEGLAEWLMPNDFAPVVGHRFTFTDTPRPPFYDGLVGCEVLELDPPRLLTISWAGGPVDTVVTFRLVPLGSGRTRLELTHTGFSGLKAGIVRAILGLGWSRLLRRHIPRALAAHRGA
ncbi:MAG: SRPBCC domain-containing protein [Acidimicrobiia bacterium]